MFIGVAHSGGGDHIPGDPGALHGGKAPPHPVFPAVPLYSLDEIRDMKDDFPLALHDGLLDEREEWLSETPPPAQLSMPPPPASREAALAGVGAVKRGVYTLVRQCVDDFEKAAPWEQLYYPPEGPEELTGLVGNLIIAIKTVPKKIDVLLRALAASEAGRNDPTREEIGFLLHGIHRMVGHDLKRLETVLAPLRERAASGGTHSTSEGVHLCELSADLKGKYASALMGAAASLIGEGLWNSVELEPVLFPEKAEEFRCTRDLLAALREVVAAIRQLPEQIPFVQVVERWRQGSRADQYALADLAYLRGRLGRLLKERSRRALYSGDYHQISRREVALSLRINELERLHFETWALRGPGPLPDLSAVYPRLVQLTLEMAAVLDAEILKSLVGEKKVNGLRGASVSKRTPKAGEEGLDALVPLLAEDDLRIFFEMLVTAVQRRASLTLPEARPTVVPAPAAPATPAPASPAAPKRASPIVTPPSAPALEALAPLSSIEPAPAQPVHDLTRAPASAPAFRPAAPSPLPAAGPRVLFARVLNRLDEMQAPGHASWNAFRMTQRLIAKHSRLPAAMFRSVHPFLQEIADGLVPDLKAIAPYRSLTVEAVLRLETVCQELCRDDPTPEDLAVEIPRKLERIVRFLDALRAVLSAT
jgi:hypothetical protein